MKNVLTIFKKEWDRVIKDKRLLFSVMILPGLMIFIIYSFMGTAMTSLSAPDPGNIAIVNPTEGFTSIYALPDNENIDNIITIAASEIPTYMTLVDQGEWDLIIVFPANIESNLVDGYQATADIYYNGNESQSQTIYQVYRGYLDIYGKALSYQLYEDTTVLLYNVGTQPIDEKKLMGTIMATLLPMLVVMFLFSGAMAIGPESIAGEKERGTMATLLVTPVKRSQIAMGKVASLGVLSLLSAISSFIGIITSFPKLFGEDIDFLSIYGIGEYAMILGLLFSTVFVIVGVISVVSAYAKNLKEAGTLITPIYLLTIIIGISSIFGEGANASWWYYLIPIYNTVQSLIAVLTFDPNITMYMMITVMANLVFTALLIVLLNRMFNSEKIMFSK
ncbi:MAG: ABC transporter permease [Candidatus Izemoplasmatales bacterium]|jgi:sodium transport system permease protein|nr:ABC transporter permease [Candidatus Izemoplasmatales bacterium]